MPLYDYECQTCEIELEQSAHIAERHKQRCPHCSSPLNMIFKPTPCYTPFHEYFDFALGEHVTGRMQRQRLMHEKGLDFRDKMSKGDISARIDKVNEAKRGEGRRR